MSIHTTDETKLIRYHQQIAHAHALLERRKKKNLNEPDEIFG